MLLGMLPVCELCKFTGQTEDNFSSIITKVILLDPGPNKKTHDQKERIHLLKTESTHVDFA